MWDLHQAKNKWLQQAFREKQRQQIRAVMNFWWFCIRVTIQATTSTAPCFQTPVCSISLTHFHAAICRVKIPAASTSSNISRRRKKDMFPTFDQHLHPPRPHSLCCCCCCFFPLSSLFFAQKKKRFAKRSDQRLLVILKPGDQNR